MSDFSINLKKLSSSIWIADFSKLIKNKIITLKGKSLFLIKDLSEYRNLLINSQEEIEFVNSTKTLLIRMLQVIHVFDCQYFAWVEKIS